jgi:hypothetical protein
MGGIDLRFFVRLGADAFECLSAHDEDGPQGLPRRLGLVEDVVNHLVVDRFGRVGEHVEQHSFLLVLFGLFEIEHSCALAVCQQGKSSEKMKRRHRRKRENRKRRKLPL